MCVIYWIWVDEEGNAPSYATHNFYELLLVHDGCCEVGDQVWIIPGTLDPA